jgi:putative transposase
MSQGATARSLRRTRRAFKRMGFQAEGFEDWRDGPRRLVRLMFQREMNREVQRYLSRARAQGPADRRNGYYRRHLLTALGDIELSIPRTRRFNPWKAIAGYARRTPDLDSVLLSCFVLGLSVRKVPEALRAFLGVEVSGSTVSRVSRALDQEVKAFHRRPLKDRYRALLFDGVVVRGKTGAGAQGHSVLVALGIGPDRRKEIIDFRVARGESEDAWQAFLTDLWDRGLHGEGVEIIAVDGGAGLLATLPTVYPRISVQRCWAHKVRNILDKIRKADREAAKADLRKIYQAEGIRAARSAARQFADRWEGAYPRAVKCLRNDLEELLNFFSFSDPDWRRAVRTTNAIERRFREVRRRTRPMGVMADRTSIERILYAVFQRENRRQGTGHPFLLTQKS